METEVIKLKETIKKLLAEFLGIDIEDIKDEYSFSNDLHMTPVDITDFFQILEANHINISEIDLSQIETFEDLVENLSLHE